MRAEVKIGIIIGLVVFGGGLVFFLSQGKKAGKDVVDNVPLNKPATTADTKDKPGGAAQLPGARHTPSKPAGTDRTQATANRPGTEPGTAPKTTPTTPPKVTPAPGTPGSTRPAGTPATGTLPPRTDRSADSTPRPLTGEPWPTPTPASRPLSVPPAAGPTTQPAEPLPGPSHGAPGVAVPPSPATEPPPPAATPTFPPDRTTPTTAAKKHTVAKGETLSVIAEQYYGDKNLWPKIKAANPAIDPDRLLVGQVLVIPAKDEAAATGEKTAADKKPADGATKPAAEKKPNADENKPKARPHTYVVEQYDTLISIARNVLKDGSRWREIYELNKSKIPNPDHLLVGTELLLPEK